VLSPAEGCSAEKEDGEVSEEDVGPPEEAVNGGVEGFDLGRQPVMGERQADCAQNPRQPVHGEAKWSISKSDSRTQTKNRGRREGAVARGRETATA
jgi:hypothetical protein